MSDRQVRIFYFVLFVIVILIFLFWSFFLKSKWQENEVAVIELEPYSAVVSSSQAVHVEQAVAIVEASKEVIVESEAILSEGEISWGNGGYVTKDGRTTYRPVARGLEDEDEPDDE